MKNLFVLALTSALVLGCSASSNSEEKTLYTEQFPGFSFSGGNNPQLSGYEYQSSTGEAIEVRSCKEVDNLDPSGVAEYDYFRFRLVQMSCKAAEMFAEAADPQQSNFPPQLGTAFVEQLPATVAPLLSNEDYQQKQGSSLESYYADAEFTEERPKVFKLVAEDDEVYLTLLARGDFTADGSEDLLVQTEWYAREAHGTHVDLLVLSKKSNGQVEVSWRLNEVK